MGDDTSTTVSQQRPEAVTPKKRFIGKAKAEALRRQALLQKEKQHGLGIEDSVVALKGAHPVPFTQPNRQGQRREAAES